MGMIEGGPPSQAGATAPIRSIKACVVYDRMDGEIHHHRRVMTLEGGHEPSDGEMAEDALQRAVSGHKGPPAELFRVLHVAPDAIKPNMRYHVDVAKGVLVEL